MKKYYIIINNKQEGPFAIEELKSKINLETFVWYEGLEKWIKAKEIPELKNVFVQSPPPFNEKEDNESEDYILAEYQQRFFALLINLVVFIFILFIISGRSLFDETNSESSTSEFADFIISAIVWSAFNAIFYPFFSGTLGHKIMGIMIVESIKIEKFNTIDMILKPNHPFEIDIIDRKLNRFFRALYREFFKIIFLSFIFPCLWIFLNKTRKCLHDYILNTTVIKNIY